MYVRGKIEKNTSHIREEEFRPLKHTCFSIYDVWFPEVCAKRVKNEGIVSDRRVEERETCTRH